MRSQTRFSRFGGEQPQDLGVAFWTILGLDRGQPIVAQSSEGGEGSVQGIVLSGVATREYPHPRAELGRDIHHWLACEEELLGQGPPYATCTLHGPERRSGKRFA